MKQKAFTLLETVISLGIVTLAISVGLQANRTLLQSGTIAVERAQATMLIGDAVAMLESTNARLNNLPSGPRITWTSHLGIAPGQSRLVVPYVTTLAPTSVELCMDTGLAAGLGSSCSGTTTRVTLPDDSVQTLSSALSDPDGELIVVSPLDTSRAITDATTQEGDVLPYNPQDRDYYRRKVQIVASSVLSGAQGIEARITVKNMRTNQVTTRTIFFAN